MAEPATYRVMEHSHVEGWCARCVEHGVVEQVRNENMWFDDMTRAVRAVLEERDREANRAKLMSLGVIPWGNPGDEPSLHKDTPEETTSAAQWLVLKTKQDIHAQSCRCPKAPRCQVHIGSLDPLGNGCFPHDHPPMPDDLAAAEMHTKNDEPFIPAGFHSKESTHGGCRCWCSKRDRCYPHGCRSSQEVDKDVCAEHAHEGDLVAQTTSTRTDWEETRIGDPPAALIEIGTVEGRKIRGPKVVIEGTLYDADIGSSVLIKRPL